MFQAIFSYTKICKLRVSRQYPVDELSKKTTDISNKTKRMSIGTSRNISHPERSEESFDKMFRFAQHDEARLCRGGKRKKRNSTVNNGNRLFAAPRMTKQRVITFGFLLARHSLQTASARFERRFPRRGAPRNDLYIAVENKKSVEKLRFRKNCYLCGRIKYLIKTNKR